MPVRPLARLLRRPGDALKLRAYTRYKLPVGEDLSPDARRERRHIAAGRYPRNANCLAIHPHGQDALGVRRGDDLRVIAGSIALTPSAVEVMTAFQLSSPSRICAACP